MLVNSVNRIWNVDAEESSVKAIQVLAKRLIELQEEVERQGNIIQEKLECKDR